MAHIVRGAASAAPWVSLLILAITAGAGCSREAAEDPLGPSSRAGQVSAARGLEASGYGSASFYPLSIGAEWAYRGEITVVVFNTHPTPEGDTLAQVEFTEHHRIVGDEERGGRRYRARAERRLDSQGFDSEFVSFVRQDRTGLYAALTDMEVPPPPSDSGAGATAIIGGSPGTRWESELARRGLPPASIERLRSKLERARRAVRGLGDAGGMRGAVSADELTWLAYPLHPGASWDIQPEFPWPARVDRIERLQTPAGPMVAYRIETDPFGTTVGDGEWIRLYYGRSGYLGYSVHLVEPPTSQGDVYTVIDDSMLLTSADLPR